MNGHTKCRETLTSNALQAKSPTGSSINGMAKSRTSEVADHPLSVEAAGPARADIRTEKVSVSLPSDLTTDVRTRVGSRGFSGYVARAVRRQVERDDLDALLAEMQAVNGPVPEDLLAAVEALWPDSGGRSRR
ncbi:MAG: hypothetical protein NVS3B21_32180 [Acidimicrobiales bacterium]